MIRTALSILTVLSCLASGSLAAEVPGRRVVTGGWFAPRVTKTARPVAPKAVFVIPIRVPIMPVLLDVLKYKITRARSQGADMIIFDMDTPGGRGDVMNAIIKMIRNDLTDIYTVCWVHPQAHSAGAMIALGCDEIVITADGIIGDSMPILFDGQGLQTLPAAERSKLEAPIRKEARDLAERNGYNADVCEGMINTNIILWVIRQRETNEMQIVKHHDWQNKVDNIPGVARNPEAKWEYVRLFDAADQLVDLKTREALFSGLAAAKCDTLDEVKTRYGITGEVETLVDQPLDSVAHWLNSPAIAGILMTVMILAFFGEIRTPGVGVYGAIALLCLLLIIGSKAIVGLANTIEVGLFALGVVLLILEFFVIPGFGVAGIAGIALMGIATLGMLLPNAPGEFPWPSVEGDWTFIVEGIYSTVIAFAVGVAGGLAITASAPKLPIARRVILSAPAAPSGEAQQDSAPIHRLQPGESGVALSTLRPSGRAQFAADVVDVIADGMAIAQNAPIRIVRIDGNRIVVEPQPNEA